MKTTIFKFHYKDHLVRAVVNDKDGRAYVLGPDIMPLFGYKKRPLVDINQLLTKGSDKKFIYGVPVISLAGITFLEAYPKTKKKKAQKVYDWVSDEVLPLLESSRPVSLPDEVRTESWEEADFKRYLEEVEEDEENRLSTHKEVLKFKMGGETVAKAKIDTQKCSLSRALGGLLTSAIFSKCDGKPDPAKVSKTLHFITDDVMETVLEDYATRLTHEEY